MGKTYTYKRSFYAYLIYLLSFKKFDTSTYITYEKSYLFIYNAGEENSINYQLIGNLKVQNNSLLILSKKKSLISEIKYLNKESVQEIDYHIKKYYKEYRNYIIEQERIKEIKLKKDLEEKKRIEEEKRLNYIKDEFEKNKTSISTLYKDCQLFFHQNKYIGGNEADRFENHFQTSYYNLIYLENLCDDKALDKNILMEFNYISKINYTFWKEIENSRKTFLLNAFKKEKKEVFFKNIGKPYGLTPKQIEACLINDDNNLVLAGAGSGKTLTMIARAAYLIKNNLAKPEEILILAYNTKAAKELRERCTISEYTKYYENNKNNISTFHSFGYKLLSLSNGGKFKKPLTGQEQNEVIKLILEKNAIINEDFFTKIIKYFLYYSFPFPDKNKYGFKTIGEYADFMKNYNIQSINPRDKYPFSTFEECLIANFLFVNSINYEVYTYLGKQYFHLVDYEVYIIYEHDSFNNINSISKFNIFEKKFINNNYIKLTYRNLTIDTIEAILKKELEDTGIYCKVLSSNEIFDKIKQSKILDSFIKFIISFTSLYKNNDSKILTIIKNEYKDNSFSSKRINIFLEIFEIIFNLYKIELEASQRIDFDDMIFEAIEYVQSGYYVPPYKYIMIDEFQDISKSRALLIQEILTNISEPNLFCVGDDWQAIYRFAGSSIKFISNFTEEFRNPRVSNCSKTILDYTFRFNDKILNTSTNFVTQNPEQEQKDIKVIHKENEPKINIIHRNNEKDEKIVFNLLRNFNIHVENEKEIKISKTDKDEEKDKIIKERIEVLILNRYQKYKNIGSKAKTKEYFSSTKMQEMFKHLQISYDTMHGSKGTEAEYVILVDIKGGFYGFPTKKDNDEIIELLLPKKEKYPFAEERRLMYVALTRAKKEVWIESIQDQESEFITELRNKKHLYEINEIFMNKKEEGSLQVDDDICCPMCETGKIISTYNSTSKKWFNACNNFPYCNYTLKNCLNENCKSESGLIRESENEYRCISCNERFKICTTCNDGIRTQCYIQEYNTTYINCSNVNLLDCKPQDNKINDHQDMDKFYFPECKR